jgi:exodeoxyribonuclease V alpha subunit
VALSIGLGKDSPQRIIAGIKHVLAASRQFGHCYLTQSQINAQVKELLELDLAEQLDQLLEQMEHDGHLMVRKLVTCQEVTGSMLLR